MEKMVFRGISYIKRPFFSLFYQRYFFHNWLYVFIHSRHIIIMTDTFNKIKEELSLYYPDVTDDDVEKLITFFKLSAKAVLETKKAETPLDDIDDS